MVDSEGQSGRDACGLPLVWFLKGCGAIRIYNPFSPPTGWLASPLNYASIPTKVMHLYKDKGSEESMGWHHPQRAEPGGTISRILVSVADCATTSTASLSSRNNLNRWQRVGNGQILLSGQDVPTKHHGDVVRCR